MNKVIKREKLLETPRFTVYQEVVLDELNNRKNYFYLQKPDAVIIIPHDNSRIAFLKVKRYLIDGNYSYELPGGRLEISESPLEAAKRELKEETGLTSIEWEYLSCVYPLPSVTTEKVYIYSANIYRDAVINLDADASNEGISGFELVDINNISQLFEKNKITCSVDGYAVLLFLQKHYNQNNGELL